MRIPRIYVPDSLVSSESIALPDQAAHHVKNVLRLPLGAEITLFNGLGGEFGGHIDTMDKRQLRVSVLAYRARECESSLIIEVGLGIAKGDRMDYAIQKATELGVKRIVPLTTERCMVALTGERADKKWEHWHAVIVSACEQCGRNRLPELAKIGELHSWSQNVQAESKFVLDPTASVSLRQHTTPKGKVAIAIGPEGGLTDKEIRLAEQSGFLPTQLGPRILRAETATVAAICALQALWGDF